MHMVENYFSVFVYKVKLKLAINIDLSKPQGSTLIFTSFVKYGFDNTPVKNFLSCAYVPIVVIFISHALRFFGIPSAIIGSPSGL